MQMMESYDMFKYFVEPTLLQETFNVASPHGLRNYDLRKLLEFKENVVITGAPGSGKTTILKYIEHAVSNSQKYKCIFIRLHDLKELNCHVYSSTSKINIYLLDGLDEVNLADQKNILNHIKSLTSQCASSRFILTSRRLSDLVKLGLDDLTILKIAELNDVQIDQFFKLHGIKDWSKAAEVIYSSRALRGVIRNPFMAKLLIQYFDVIVSSDFIVDPTIFVDRLVSDYVYKASLELGYDKIELDNILCEIAAYLHHNEKHHLLESEIRSILSNAFKVNDVNCEIDNLIKELELSYIFSKISDGMYCFSHISIYEHFLTKYLRVLIGNKDSKAIINTSSAILLAIKFDTFRHKDELSRTLINIETSLDLSSDQITPIYAREGSLEILFALAIGGVAIHLIKTFADGYFTKLGHILAERSTAKDKKIVLPSEIRDKLPPWIRDNDDALTIFTSELISQHAKNSFSEDKTIVAIAVNSVLSTKIGNGYKQISLSEFNSIDLNNENSAHKGRVNSCTVTNVVKPVKTKKQKQKVACGK